MTHPGKLRRSTFFTGRPVPLPFRKRLHYKDCSENNLSHVIGAVEFARWETSWALDFKQKKMFGDYHVAVGGHGDAEPADDMSET